MTNTLEIVYIDSKTQSKAYVTGHIDGNSIEFSLEDDNGVFIQDINQILKEGPLCTEGMHFLSHLHKVLGAPAVTRYGSSHVDCTLSNTALDYVHMQQKALAPYIISI